MRRAVISQRGTCGCFARFSETRKSTPDVDTYSIEEDYCTKENQGHIYLDVHTRIAQAKLEIMCLIRRYPADVFTQARFRAMLFSLSL